MPASTAARGSYSLQKPVMKRRPRAGNLTAETLSALLQPDAVVVCANFGVARVIGKENTSVAGIEISAIRFAHVNKDAYIIVPEHKLATAVRALPDVAELEAADTIISAVPKKFVGTAPKTVAHYETLSQSFSPADLAQIVRDFRKIEQGTLPYAYYAAFLNAVDLLSTYEHYAYPSGHPKGDFIVRHDIKLRVTDTAKHLALVEKPKPKPAKTYHSLGSGRGGKRKPSS